MEPEISPTPKIQGQVTVVTKPRAPRATAPAAYETRAPLAPPAAP